MAITRWIMRLVKELRRELSHSGPRRKGLGNLSPPRPKLRNVEGISWILDLVILTLIAVLFWMALGDVPGWIARPVMVFWWGWVGLKFLVLGLPFLIVPLWLLWDVVRPGGKPEPDRTYEEAEAEAAQRLDEEADIKAFGVIPRNYFLTMRRVLLLLGLLATGEYPLAALYIFPNLAEFILNQINRLRAAFGGQRT